MAPSKPLKSKPTGPQAGDPAPDAGDLALAHALEMLEPMIQGLVAQGVGYTALSRALKPLFVRAAQVELAREEAKLTDAAVSVRSGVHRKDVRVLSQPESATTDQAGKPSDPPRALSLAGQVYTVWTTDARYRDADGNPVTLPLNGPAPSFDSLLRSVSTDLSRRTVLDELVRLGLVSEADGKVTPQASAMVPTQAYADTLHFLSANVRDHLAAGMSNLRAVADGEKPRFLEHSMYAEGISDASVSQLANLAGQLWKPVFNQVVDAARQRYELDRDHEHRGRIRYGVYVYTEPDQQPGPDEPQSGKKK